MRNWRPRWPSGLLVSVGVGVLLFGCEQDPSPYSYPGPYPETQEALISVSSDWTSRLYASVPVGNRNGARLRSLLQFQFEQLDIEQDEEILSLSLKWRTATRFTSSAPYPATVDAALKSMRVFAVRQSWTEAGWEVRSWEESWDLWLEGDYLFVARGEAGIAVYDTIASWDPILVAVVPEVAAYDLWLDGRVLYTAARQNGLGLVDVTYPSDPVAGDMWSTPGQANGVWAGGGYACIADGLAGVTVLDVSDPASVTFVENELVNAEALEVNVLDGFAYLGRNIERNALNVVDVRDPTDLKMRRRVRTKGRAGETIFEGERAYVVYRGGMSVFGVDDPQDPEILVEYEMPGDGMGVALKDSVAYVASGPAGLFVVDLSDVEEPEIIGHLQTEHAVRRVAIKGDVAYLAATDGGTLVVNVSQPATPLMLRTLPLAEPPLRWDVAGVVDPLTALNLAETPEVELSGSRAVLDLDFDESGVEYLNLLHQLQVPGAGFALVSGERLGNWVVLDNDRYPPEAKLKYSRNGGSRTRTTTVSLQAVDNADWPSPLDLFQTEPVLLVGNWDGYLRYAGFYFDVTGLSRFVDINFAELKVYMEDVYVPPGQRRDDTIEVIVSPSVYKPRSARRLLRASDRVEVATDPDIEPGWLSFDVTDLVRDWHEEEQEATYLYLISTDEDLGKTTFLQLRSKEFDTGADTGPILRILYSEPPDLPDLEM